MAKMLLKAAFVASLLGLALLAVLLWGVFDKIGAVASLLLGPYVAGLPSSLVLTLTPILAALLTVPITGLAVQAFKLKIRYLLPSVIVGLAAMTGIWNWGTRDWLFDFAGRPLVFVCPPVQSGEPFRIQRYATDHVLSGECPSVNRETAALVVAQRRGVQPVEVIVKSVADLEALPRYSATGPILFVAEPLSPNSPPRLFRGGGFDAWTGKPLRPVTDADIAQQLTWLAEQVRAAAAEEAAKAEQALKASEELAQEQAKHLPEEAAKKVKAEQERIAALPLWQSYFRAAIDEEAPLVIAFGEGTKQLKIDVGEYMAQGEFWTETNAEKTFLAKVSNDNYLHDPLRGMRRDMFPPGLEKMIVVRIDKAFYCHTTSGELRLVANLTYVEFDIKAWRALTRTNTVYFNT